MAKFGRFDFGNNQPSEIYKGDRIQLDRNFVKILIGESDLIDIHGENLVAVIHLDKGQSVQKINETFPFG